MIKSLIPGFIKTEAKFYLMKLLKIPYSRVGFPVEILKYLKKENISILDVGASQGHFVKQAEKHYKISIAILLEPLKNKFEIINKDIAGKVNYFAINKAVSNIDGVTSFYINPDIDQTSSMLKIKSEIKELSLLKIKESIQVDCETVMLDTLFESFNLKDIDLLKVDVQGTEHLVFQGAENSLKSIKYIYTEFSYKALYEGSSTFFDLYNHLTKKGFILLEINEGYRAPNNELLQGDAFFMNTKYSTCQ